MTKVSPCKGCERRTIDCHAECDDYKAWREWRKEVAAWLKDHRGPTSKRAQEIHYRRIMRRARGYERKRSDK